MRSNSSISTRTEPCHDRNVQRPNAPASGVLVCDPVVVTEARPEPSRNDKHKFLLILGLIMLIAFGARVANLAITQWNQVPAGDARFYSETAKLLAEGHGYIDPFRYLEGYPDLTERRELDHFGQPITVELPPGLEQPTMSHPPAWTFVLAGARFLGIDTPNQQRLLGVLLGTLGVGLIGLAGRELFGEGVGLIAAGIGAVYGFLILNDASLMSESLVAIFVPVATIVAVRWWRSPSLRLACMLGLLAGAGGLLRAELIIYTPLVLIGALVVRRFPWRRTLGHGALAAVVMAVVLAPWIARNLTAFAEPMVLSQTGTTLAQTNCDATYYGDKLGYWELYCGGIEPATSVDSIPDESQRDVLRRAQAFDYIATHRVRFMTVAVPVRVLRMFNLFGPVQTAKYDVVVEGRNLQASLVSLAEYYVVAALAVVGTALALRRRLTLYVVLLWPALVVMVAVLGFGNNRYRVTCEPAFFWLAGVAIYSAFGLIRDARRRRDSATTQNTAISVS